jgi:protoporphyrinogen oxidase
MVSANTKANWAVVGGGFLGMTLALRLARQGKRVTLFEAAPSLGGLASAWQLGDVVWDKHYHVTLFSDSFVRSLLRELGLEEQMRWAKTRTAFYAGAELHSMSNLLEFLRFPLLNLTDKIRLGATILHASRIKNSRSLEGIRVKEWLEKWSGRRTTEKIWLPLLRAKLGDSHEETSAAFIWASIARMHAARRTRSKTELFGYIPGGYARIIERFAEVLKTEQVDCELGRPVTEIMGTVDGKIEIRVQGERPQTFDQVIVTAAAPAAVRACPQLTAAEKHQWQQIRYQGIICASLLLKNSLADFYITNITDSDLPYTAVIEMSALVDKDQFRGRALVYLPKYVSADSPDFDLSDAQIQEKFLAGLEKMYPAFRREDVLCFQVSRVRYLLPIPTLNYSDTLPQTTTSVPGLHIVNSAHIVNGTLNVNETVQLAETTAKRFATRTTIAAQKNTIIEHEFAKAHS